MRRPSLRAEIARMGLRWLVRRRSHHQSLDQARQAFQAMEALYSTPAG